MTENLKKTTLTVFTPTYNRAYLLPQCYESLKRQTSRDFLWLIVDDGSSDGTAELVSKWQAEENDFEIRYIYQENQGITGAHNTAYSNIDTELNVCIDSDNYMTDDAVEKIITFWTACEKDDRVSGIIGLVANQKGELNGGGLKEGVPRARLYDYYQRYGARGEKTLVYRSELTRLYPFPRFEGEKFVDQSTKYFRIDIDHELLALSEVLCILEYLPDGFTADIFGQYKKNAAGYAYSRKVLMSLPYASFKYRFRQAVHYVSCSIIRRNGKFLSESPRKAITVLAVPFGVLLYFYIRRRSGHPTMNESG